MHSLSNLGSVSFQMGDYEQALQYAQDSLALAGQLGGVAIPCSYQTAGHALYALGNPEQAAIHFRKAADSPINNWYLPCAMGTIIGAAFMLADEGKLERSVQLLALAQRYVDNPTNPTWNQIVADRLSNIEAKLDSDLFAAALAYHDTVEPLAVIKQLRTEI